MDLTATTSVLLSALKDTAEAHGIYEELALGGVFDKNWPEWYARHMARVLAEQGYTITASEEPPART